MNEGLSTFDDASPPEQQQPPFTFQPHYFDSSAAPAHASYLPIYAKEVSPNEYDDDDDDDIPQQ